MFNIAEFSAEINDNGFSKASNYDLVIFGPNVDSTIERRIQMRTLSIILPGRQVETSQFSYYGIHRNFAKNSVFNRCDATILLSEDFGEKDYLEKWIDIMVGNYRTSAPNPNMYDPGFYDDYIGNIEIYNYNAVGEQTLVTKLIEAWPVVVSDIQLQWSGGEELLTLPVSFVFKYYTNPTVSE